MSGDAPLFVALEVQRIWKNEPLRVRSLGTIPRVPTINRPRLYI